MKNILSSLGESWKHFKSTLTRKYVMPFKDQPEVLKCVPKTYKSWIRQPAWDRFVEIRLSDEFQKISQLNAERRAQKKYNHRVSKKGYAGLEEELKAELGSAFDPNDRAFKWKRAHQDKNHCYVDDATKEVGERIDMYTEKVAEGEIIIEGSRDVLTLSLGTDEHYGRVRAVGKNITPTTYFHLARRSSKKHIHELESLLKEERDKRKEEEEKRKGFEHEFMLLKEKVKELEERRLVSPSERMASNSRKSDNRDYILPSDEEYQSPPKRPKKQGQEKRKDMHRVATKAKSNLGEKLNRDFEKYKSSDHQTISKPKTNANEVLSQKSKTQTTFLGTTPGLGKVKNCKLALDVRTNIVAEGKMYEGYGPDQLLHGKVLGENNLRVSIDKVLIKVDMPLPIPANEELCTVMGAKGSYVAWPRKLVIYGDNESENRKGVDADRNNPRNSNPNPTPNNKEGIQCSLAACLRADVVAKGTLYEGFGPNHKVQGIELGKENVVVSVDEVIKGYVFLPIAIDDELVVISDAHGKLMPWPKRLVIHDNDEITKRENRWKESTKIEMANKRRIDDLEKQISEFANVVESTMTTTSHVILPLEEEFLEQDLPPLYITKSEVFDICHMHQVNVICIATYMRFLYEKLKNSQTSYGFANPAIFDDFGTKNDQSKDLRNRLENAKLRKHQHILVPYNTGHHWVLIVIDMSQMKVYWLNSLKGKPAFMFICAVNSAIVAATYANGSRKREVTWESVQCPQQPGSTECAYYVMKFMRHLVNNPDQSLETKITRLGKTKTYTHGDLVEVRHEWINFIKELSPLD